MSLFYVKIYYGPYNSFYTLSHKPRKLSGLRDRLQKLGYRVDLVPVEFVNYCMIEICGYEVFRCNIKNLQYNLPYHRDPVCQRAVTAVQEATSKFSRARTYFWFLNLLSDQIFSRSEFSPQDHWPFEPDMKKFATCMDCIECCKILTHRKCN